MKYEQFEKSLLRLAFETDIRISVATVAYHLDCPVEECKRHLSRLVDNGTLSMDSDIDGNLYYELPHRDVGAEVQPPPGSLVPARPAHNSRLIRLGNALLPGLGNLFARRIGKGAVQLTLILGAGFLLFAYWKDFGDPEHKPWAVLLMVTLAATWIWSIVDVKPKAPKAVLPTEGAKGSAGD